ncbi:MAG: hypothetical protein IKB56_00770 [Clostridia bacterium]|nr:hypothetical protein [Clostridia bacterium]
MRVRKESMVKKNKESENPINKRERKPLTKKQKTISITVISVVSALLIAGIVTLVVLLVNKDDGGKGNYDMPSRKIQYEYYIDEDDTIGFTLKDNFRESVPITAFTKTEILSDEHVILDSNLALKVKEGAKAGQNAIYNFSYKGVVIAVINVMVVDADAYIHTPQELFQVANDQDKTYIVRNDLDLSGMSDNIPKFMGAIHFNHNYIKGFNASNGGLFKELNGATVTGLDLTEVTGATVLTDYGNLGVIADYSSNSKLRYCSVSGNVSITSNAEVNDVIYVGGFVGYVSALSRKNYVDIEPTYVHLVSFLNVTIGGGGDFRVGGLVGGVKNATLNNCFSYGEINFNVNETQVANLKNLYLGGMVGALSKEYNTITQTAYLDESNGLYSYSNINVNVSGGGVHNSINVGGVFGYLENHSVVNCTYGGKTDIQLTRASLNVGGIIGATNNDTTLKMNVRGIIVKGEIKIYSLATVYAGGLIGESVETQYSFVEQSVTPTINTDNSKVQGTQVATPNVANVKQ